GCRTPSTPWVLSAMCFVLLPTLTDAYTFPYTTLFRSTVPTESPGRFGVSDVAGVGYGTVKVVLPASPVARACAIKAPLRMKFTTGEENPTFAKSRRVIV